MKSSFKPVLAAGLAMLLTMAPSFTAPAAAQVSGNIATVDIALAVAGADARAAAYQQISSTYQQQLTLIQQRQHGVGWFDKLVVSAQCQTLCIGQRYLKFRS